MSLELRGPVDRSGIHWWFEHRVKGRCFRRKNGKVVYRADRLEIDASYERHYGFLNVLVKLRDTRNGKALTVDESEFRYGFVEVDT